MRDIEYSFSDRLQKLVDMGESGTDILHGELKNLMYQTEQLMDPLDKTEEEMTYLEGLMDAYTTVYQLTYDLSFAIGARREARG